MSNNNAVPSEASLLEFSEVVLRAIELSWRDAEFKAQLLENPLSAMEHYFHYKCEWNFDLQMKEVTDIGQYGWDNKSRAWNLPKDTISFGLPAAPKEIKQHAVALAMYNDAGPMYLFTCC